MKSSLAACTLASLLAVASGFTSSSTQLPRQLPRQLLPRHPIYTTRSATTTTTTSLNAEPLEGTVAVCTGPTCRKKGGRKTIALMEELAAEVGVTVEKINCVSECAECALGEFKSVFESFTTCTRHPFSLGGYCHGMKKWMNACWLIHWLVDTFFNRKRSHVSQRNYLFLFAVTHLIPLSSQGQMWKFAQRVPRAPFIQRKMASRRKHKSEKYWEWNQ